MVFPQEGADAVAEAESQTGDVSGDEGDPKDTGGAQNLLATPVIARLGTSLQVLNLAFRGGDGLGPLPLRPTLLRMLEPLLKIQVGIFPTWMLKTRCNLSDFLLLSCPNAYAGFYFY